MKNLLSLKALIIGIFILITLSTFAGIGDSIKVKAKILKSSEKLSKVEFINKLKEGKFRQSKINKKAKSLNKEIKITKINNNLKYRNRINIKSKESNLLKKEAKSSGYLRYLPHIAFSDGWLGQINVKNDSAYFSTVTFRFSDPDGYMENVKYYVDDDSTLYMGNDLEVRLYPYESVSIDLVESEYGFKHVAAVIFGDTESFSISANYMQYGEIDNTTLPIAGFAVTSPFETDLAEGYEMNSRMGVDPYSDYYVTGGFALFNPNDYYIDVVIEMRDEFGYTMGDVLMIQNIPPYGKYVSTLNSSQLFGNLTCPVATFEFQGFEAGTSNRIYFSMVGGKFKGLASISLPMTGFLYN